MVSCAATDTTAEAGGTTYQVKRWTTDDGLPQNRIACLKQTRDGYLWIGTWAGLVRFDGMKFTVYNKFNTPELVSDAINALAQDQSGTLWIGTADGLVSYREHRFFRLTRAEGLPDRHVEQLAKARSGGVWLQAGDSIARFEHGKFSRSSNLPAGQRVLSLQERAEGWLDIFTDRGWLSLPPEASQVITNRLEQPPAFDWLAALRAKPNGNLLIGTWEGLHSLEPELLKGIASDQLDRRAVDLIYQDRETNLWVNTQPGGLLRWDGSGWNSVDLGGPFTRASVICLEEDLEGNLWAGSDQGLAQLQPRRVVAYTAKQGLADDNVWSVCEGTDGAIWAGTCNGMSCIRSGRVVPVEGSEGAEPYPNCPDRCVWPSRAGGVWIAKQGIGVMEFRNRAFEWRVRENELPGLVAALYEDHSGRLWIGTAGSLGHWQNGRFKTFETRPSNASAATRPGEAPLAQSQIPETNSEMDRDLAPIAVLRDVHSVLEDRGGNLWFGTKGHGLARLRGGVLSVFTERDGLGNDCVWSIHEDAEGALWLGTGNGLTRFQEGKFFVFGLRHGLPENTVNCVLEDALGYLWLSGLHGIHRVKRADLNAVAEGRSGAVQAVTYGTADGMESAETNGGENQPSGWKARDGRLWFPTVRGAVVIDPKTIPSTEAPPPVVIEQVKADEEVVFGDGDRSKGQSPKLAAPEPDEGGSKVGGQRAKTREQSAEVGGERPEGGGQKNLQLSTFNLQLAPGHGHVLEFQYTANTFAAPERARFRYRLVGADGDWREETSERTVRYINLRPGDYRFEVTAANHHNVWNLEPAAFAFTLAPHFWETWTFYALCACGVVGLAAAVQAYRLRWQRRLLKLEEQRAWANERARIARDLHDDLGTALTGLALELDVTARETGAAAPVTARLEKTATRTRELAERMREVVWTVNPKCDTVSSLAAFLEQQVGQFLRADGVRVRLDFPEDIPELPLAAEVRHQLALGVREALANIVKHAHAKEAAVSLAFLDDMLVVQVKDDGHGFSPNAGHGHGLANMGTRMKQIGGTFECASAPGSGTLITFRVPLPKPDALNSQLASDSE